MVLLKPHGYFHSEVGTYFIFAPVYSFLTCLSIVRLFICMDVLPPFVWQVVHLTSNLSKRLGTTHLTSCIHTFHLPTSGVPSLQFGNQFAVSLNLGQQMAQGIDQTVLVFRRFSYIYALWSMYVYTLTISKLLKENEYLAKDKNVNRKSEILSRSLSAILWRFVLMSRNEVRAGN